MAAEMIPTSRKEVEALGWDYIDIILFSGDAYVDHPSFGTAVIARWLQKHGYRVAVVPQPNWRDDLRDFRKLGRPRLYFGVNAGAMDSMVNHYTASKRLRSDDAYTPDGKAGQRPDYAVTVYTKILKELYPDVPVVIGGIEASLRRLTHYDYWKDDLMPSVLVSSGADWLCYGMGERPMLELTEAIEAGRNLSDIRRIPQIAFLMSGHCRIRDAVTLHSYEKCRESKEAFAENFRFRRIDVFRLVRAAPVFRRHAGNFPRRESDDAPLNVRDRHDQARLEAGTPEKRIRRAVRPDEHPGRRERLRRKAVLFQRVGERAGTLRRQKPDAELARRFRVETAFPRPIIADARGELRLLAEFSGKILRRKFVNVEKLAAQRALAGVPAALFVFDRQPEAPRDAFDGFRERQVFARHQKLEDVAALPRAEAVVKPFFRIDEKRRRLLVRERAEPFPLRAGAPQRRVVSDERDDVGAGSDFVDGLSGNKRHGKKKNDGRILSGNERSREKNPAENFSPLRLICVK